MKSILQRDRQCLICGSPYVEEHHVFEGTRRRASEQWGMKVYLCPEHHRGNTGVHQNTAFPLWLKKAAQKRFEQRWGHEKFMEVFKKSWL